MFVIIFVCLFPSSCRLNIAEISRQIGEILSLGPALEPINVTMRPAFCLSGKSRYFYSTEIPDGLSWIFSLTQHARDRVVSPINESPAASFELPLAICARLA